MKTQSDKLKNLKWWLNSYSPHFVIFSTIKYPEFPPWVESYGVNWKIQKRFVTNKAGFQIYSIK